MFTGYNVDMNGYTFHSTGEYEKFLKSKKKQVTESLEKYKTVKGEIDVASIIKDWFQDFDAHIFISHSHNDEERALAFAGWLYDRFRIRAFVDSAIWNHSDELLRVIDDRYCVIEGEPGKSYYYERRNISTTHVHMILNGELMKMIDKCECLMFINTPNSTTTKEIIDKKQTHSAWIYSELLFSGMVRHKELSEYRQMLVHKSYKFDEQTKLPDFNYNVSTKHLKDISYKELLLWGSEYEAYKAPEALDILYRMTGIFPDIVNG